MNLRPLISVALLSVLCSPADALTVKKLWVARHSLHPDYYVSNLSGAATVADSAGNVVVTGFDRDSGGVIHHFMAKYSSSTGELLWQTRLSGQIPFPSFFAGNSLNNRMTVDTQDNVIVHLEFEAVSGHVDYVAKYAASDGARLWDHWSNGGFKLDEEIVNTGAANVAVDALGDIIASGITSASGSSTLLHLRKYASRDGHAIWDKTNGDNPEIITVNAAGNAIVPGFGGISAYAPNGTRLWSRHIDSGGFLGPYPTAAAVDKAGNIAVTGHLNGLNGVLDGDVVETFRYSTTRLSANGTLLWQTLFQSDFGAPTGLAVDGAGNVTIGGFGYALGSFRINGVFLKYAARDGTLLWTRRIKGKLHDGLEVPFGAYSVAMDDSGHAILAGTRSRQNNFGELLTTKVAADGTPIWKQIYDGPGDGEEVATGVSAGPGFVVASGVSSKLGLGVFGDTNNIVIVKYVDGATPQTLPAEAPPANGITLRGSINPNSFATNVAFEYSTDPSFANAVSLAPVAIGKGTTAIPISTNLTGLNPVTTYYYRVVATANSHATRGAILHFTTPPRWD